MAPEQLGPYSPHPFHWVPGAERRHATKVSRWRCERTVGTLCGQEVAPADTVLAWLWETCPACDVAAHRLAGVPMPPGRRARASPRRGAAARVGDEAERGR
ncbi:zinc finger protein [Saccharopolyspora cebuensis]|uniref:Zinc finger protein n=1 Tax=Saccharopolyspora cebuensis TaxID=418759 RepID=A0ABV4CJ72_9PSEU